MYANATNTLVKRSIILSKSCTTTRRSFSYNSTLLASSSGATATSSSSSTNSPTVGVVGVDPAVVVEHTIPPINGLPQMKTRRRRVTNLKSKLTNGPSFEDFVMGKAADMLVDPLEQARSDPNARLPSWLKTPIPKGKSFHKVKKDLSELKLSTVCEEAKCPNIGECWGGKKSEATATIMLMGDTCTRGCRFCSVKTSRTPGPLDPNEPENTAEAISRWGLGYVVLTTVDRDDLADGGAYHLKATVEKIKQKAPQILVEVLSGDFRGDLEMAKVLASSPLDVFAHNMETVEDLTPHIRDRRATYHNSLAVLKSAKEANSKLITKTSLMLGFGESDEQILQTLKDLRSVDCDVVTFGQYMRPTKRHMKVVEYIRPEKFEYWKQTALDLGFLYCASGPLVRSSYKAGEAFIENVLKKRRRNSITGASL